MSTPLDAWLDALAQPTGSPGGGAACGVMISIAASLLNMVAGYTDHRRAAPAGMRALELRQSAQAAAELDGDRSARLGAALGQPEGPERDGLVRTAAIGAAESSAKLAEIAAALRAELALLDAIADPQVAADVEVARAALEAGMQGATANLRANIALAQAHREPGDDAEDALAALAASPGIAPELTLDGLLALEKRGWDALCAGTGHTFYGELMTDDAVMVLSNGWVLDRAGVIASLEDAPPWDDYALSDARLAMAGEDAAAVVYRAHATRSGEQRFEALMASIYRRVDGRLRLVLYQQTPASGLQ
jgi:formiminotetrahydrofolate cyclodeaminase